MNYKKNQTITRVYGIYRKISATEEKRINNTLEKSNSSILPLLPVKHKMNIYFTSAVEASKVTQLLKENNNHFDYGIFPTFIEKLNRKKNFVDNDKDFQAKHPRIYRRISNYKIYNSAQEYIESINSKSINENEYGLTK